MRRQKILTRVIYSFSTDLLWPRFSVHHLVIVSYLDLPICWRYLADSFLALLYYEPDA